jgi:hypothetical protein
VGRQIANAAVQRVAQPPGGGVEVGRAVALKAAADDELVEALEPASSARIEDGDELRVDRAADGRLPAKLSAIHRGPPDAHAPRGQDDENHAAVIQLNGRDAVPLAAPQHKVPDRPAVGHPWAKLAVRGEVRVEYIVFDVDDG